MPPAPAENGRGVLLAAIAGALLLVALALSTMGGLHERHYRDRRRRILEAHLGGLELRVSAIEGILREDRLL